MSFSILEINELEHLYKVSLPERCKTILLLIGDKIIDMSLKDSGNKNALGNDINSSIYDVQNDMRDWITEYDMRRLFDPDIFFLTAFLNRGDCEYVAYFIKANEIDDSSVYSWTKDTAVDTHLIEKFTDNIEQWLYRINPILYIELQVKKRFLNIDMLR
jgi:hypothetical protein